MKNKAAQELRALAKPKNMARDPKKMRLAALKSWVNRRSKRPKK